MTKGVCEDVGVMQRTTQHQTLSGRRGSCVRGARGSYISSWLERQRRVLERERLEAEEKARRLLTGDAS